VRGTVEHLVEHRAPGTTPNRPEGECPEV